MVSLSEALTLQESDTKENTGADSITLQPLPLFRQRRIPYVLRYPQQREAFHPSPGHPVTMQQVRARVPTMETRRDSVADDGPDRMLCERVRHLLSAPHRS